MADRLAVMAEQHYRTHLPKAYAAIPAARRAAWFAELAEQANQAIQDLEDELAPPGTPMGRAVEARQTAESTVLRELILPEPETEQTATATGPEQEWDAALRAYAEATTLAQEERAQV